MAKVFIVNSCSNFFSFCYKWAISVHPQPFVCISSYILKPNDLRKAAIELRTLWCLEVIKSSPLAQERSTWPWVSVSFSRYQSHFINPHTWLAMINWNQGELNGTPCILQINGVNTCLWIGYAEVIGRSFVIEFRRWNLMNWECLIVNVNQGWPTQNTPRATWNVDNLDHGCANHATVPHPLLWCNEASLLAQWHTMYFTLAL